MGLLKILFSFFLLIPFPLGEIARVSFFNGIAVTLSDIGIGLIVIPWVLWHFLKKKKIIGAFTKPILIFISICFLSLVINIRSLTFVESSVSFLYLLRWALYAAVYFVVLEFDDAFKRKITYLMTIAGALIVLGGYVQYFLYPNLRNLYYLGWDEHLYRLFSSFLDPNFAATIISLFLIFLLSLLFLGFGKSQKIRTSLVLLSISAFIALLLTYSRSGYLMFFASVSTLLLILGRKRYIAILFVLFSLGIIILPKNLGGEGVKLLRTSSIISRSEYLSNAIAIFRDNPIIGVGFNSYRYVQRRYGFIDDLSFRTSHAGAGTDNSFLFVLATTGIVGLISYLYMWFRIIKNCHPELVSGSNEMLKPLKQVQGQHDKRKEKFRKIISVIVVSSCFGLFVNAFFINSLFYPFVMEWMWILVGLNENTVRDPSLRSG